MLLLGKLVAMVLIVSFITIILAQSVQTIIQSLMLNFSLILFARVELGFLPSTRHTWHWVVNFWWWWRFIVVLVLKIKLKGFFRPHKVWGWIWYLFNTWPWFFNFGSIYDLFWYKKKNSNILFVLFYFVLLNKFYTI